MTLSEEAKLLLKAAAEHDGIIMRLPHLGGTDVQARGRNFVDSKDARTIARWEAAVDELEEHELMQDKAGKQEVYFVTHEGFRVADGLKDSARLSREPNNQMQRTCQKCHAFCLRKNRAISPRR
jgi:hypothetical protein